jgi:hypothetical protein
VHAARNWYWLALEKAVCSHDSQLSRSCKHSTARHRAMPQCVGYVGCSYRLKQCYRGWFRSQWCPALSRPKSLRLICASAETHPLYLFLQIRTQPHLGCCLAHVSPHALVHKQCHSVHITTAHEILQRRKWQLCKSTLPPICVQ